MTSVFFKIGPEDERYDFAKPSSIRHYFKIQARRNRKQNIYLRKSTPEILYYNIYIYVFLNKLGPVCLIIITIFLLLSSASMDKLCISVTIHFQKYIVSFWFFWKELNAKISLLKASLVFKWNDKFSIDTYTLKFTPIIVKSFTICCYFKCTRCFNIQLLFRLIFFTAYKYVL